MLLLCIRMLLLCFLTSTSFSGSSPTRSVSRSAGTGRVEHPGNEVVLMLLHVTHMYSPCTRMYPCVTCTYPCGALVEIATWPAVSLWKVRTQKSFRLSLIIRVIGLLFLLTVIDVSTTWLCRNLQRDLQSHSIWNLFALVCWTRIVVCLAKQIYFNNYWIRLSYDMWKIMQISECLLPFVHPPISA